MVEVVPALSPTVLVLFIAGVLLLVLIPTALASCHTVTISPHDHICLHGGCMVAIAVAIR